MRSGRAGCSTCCLARWLADKPGLSLQTRRVSVLSSGPETSGVKDRRCLGSKSVDDNRNVRRCLISGRAASHSDRPEPRLRACVRLQVEWPEKEAAAGMESLQGPACDSYTLTFTNRTCMEPIQCTTRHRRIPLGSSNATIEPLSTTDFRNLAA